MTNSEKIISIITIAYNAYEDGLERTLNSVISQKRSDVEYLVIDGGSNDQSNNIYDKYVSSIDFIVSERDLGISDAFNKGVRNATGKFIWFVNAGDYLQCGAIQAVIDFINGNGNGNDIIYGDMVWVDGGDERILQPSSNYKQKIRYAMPFLHPSTIMSSEVFSRVGLFDLRLKRAMDYDLALRAFLAGFNAVKINRVLAYMTSGGVHDINYMATLKEVFKISRFSGGRFYIAFAMLLYTYLNKKSKLFLAFKKVVFR